MTAVEQAPLSEAEAQSLTNRIRSLGEGIADRIDLLLAAINEARSRDAHTAMGYRSWTEYVEREFASVLPRLGREPRRELVATLADTGMSNRAIAPVVGVVESTVRADLAGAQNRAPDQPITGRDGKTYARPRTPGVETRPREDHSAPGADPDTDSDAPSPAPDAERIAEAVAEFPDLAYYAEAGRTDDVRRLAVALREYAEPERSMRIDNLRKSIAVERRRAAEPPVERGPDYRKLADRIFVACNQACGVASKNGAADTIAAALDSGVLPIESDNWHDAFTDLARVCEQMAKACRPSLRRVK